MAPTRRVEHKNSGAAPVLDVRLVEDSANPSPDPGCRMPKPEVLSCSRPTFDLEHALESEPVHEGVLGSPRSGADGDVGIGHRAIPTSASRAPSQGARHEDDP